MPPEVFGPLGLTVAAVGAIVVLWREHLKADQDDRAQRDLAERLLELSLQNNRDAITAWNKRTEQDAARHRRADRP